VRGSTVWAGLLGIEHTTVEKVEYDEDAQLIVAHVRPSRTRKDRCGRCGKRSPRYDSGDGRRRWRALDLGVVRAVLEAHAPRVRCKVHGVTVAAVPWARHDTGHTRAFDDQVAWLAVQCSKTAVTELMRIAWRTVGAIITRVCADIDAVHDRLAGLRRIGIDEISYKRGHKYLTVVVDHDARRLVWAAPGRDKETLRTFFDALGEDRCAQITHVTADAADWIAAVVKERCPAAVRCADAFHVVAWATDALDQVRRQAWNDARRLARTEPKGRPGRPRQDGTQASGPRPGHERAKALKGARYALWKNPQSLTENQTAMLAWIATTDPRLHRAYLLKEGLRHVFATKGEEGKEALDRWLSWARRCQIPSFIELARKIAKHRESIDAALDHNMSNALVESTNTKILSLATSMGPA
jgi:transposase